MKKLFSLLLAALMLLCVTACTPTETPETSGNPETSATEGSATDSLPALWQSATYKEDTTLGEGAKTVTVKVVADSKTVTFTVKTDADTLGAALTAVALVEGEQGAYGLYIKKVNGIVADYDVDATYWSLSKGGEALMTGADTTNIADGETYELTRAK